MLALLVALALLPQTVGGARPPGDPGPVVLLGAAADAREVPELRELWDGRVRVAIGASVAADPDPERTVVLARERRFDADEPRAIRLVREARAIELEPAPLLDWFVALYPGKHETELVRALREAHRGGCVVAARGESVALVSAASVVGDARELGRVERDPHDVGRPRLVGGLGLQPWAVADEDARSGGSLERLLDRIAAERQRLGVWVGARAALVADHRAGAFVARGRGHCVVLDPRGSRGGEGAMRDVELSLLGPGDSWNRRQRRAEIAGARPAASSTARAAVELGRERPFEVATIVAALAELELPLPGELVLRGNDRVVRIALGDARVDPGSEDGVRGWAGLVTGFSWPAGPAATEAGGR